MLHNIKIIHEAGYVYNDIRPRNIIINNNCVKMIDFGKCIEYLDI